MRKNCSSMATVSCVFFKSVNQSPPMHSLILLVFLLAMHVALADSPAPAPAPVPERSPRLQTLVKEAINQTLQKFAAQKLETNQIAVTLVDLTDPAKTLQASYRGEEQIYPASVIKLFYLVAAHRWM